MTMQFNTITLLGMDQDRRAALKRGDQVRADRISDDIGRYIGENSDNPDYSQWMDRFIAARVKSSMPTIDRDWETYPAG